MKGILYLVHGRVRVHVAAGVHGGAPADPRRRQLTEHGRVRGAAAAAAAAAAAHSAAALPQVIVVEAHHVVAAASEGAADGGGCGRGCRGGGDVRPEGG